MGVSSSHIRKMDALDPASSAVFDLAAATAPSAADLPVMDPARPAMRYDFAKAWRHFKELVKDKENTAEVAPIFEALPWRQGYDAAKAFLATEQGQRLRAFDRAAVVQKAQPHLG